MEDLISRKSAIEALGEEPIVWDDNADYELGQRSQWEADKLAIESVPSAQPDVTDINVGDTISRQSAIDAMRQYAHYDDFDVSVVEEDIAIIALKDLPSVQEHHWIPVNERLPDEGLVLVACGKDGDAYYVAPADFARESAYEGYVKAWMQIEPYKETK